VRKKPFSPKEKKEAGAGLLLDGERKNRPWRARGVKKKKKKEPRGRGEKNVRLATM